MGFNSGFKGLKLAAKWR